MLRSELHHVFVKNITFFLLLDEKTVFTYWIIRALSWALLTIQRRLKRRNAPRFLNLGTRIVLL